MGELRQSVLIPVLAIVLAACNFPIQVADEIAREKDTITLKVNGMSYTFDGRGDDEARFLEDKDIFLWGNAGSNSIGLHLQTGAVGTYDPTSRVSVQWNIAQTLPGSGFVTIAQISDDISFVSGTFAFTAVDTRTGDTLHVTDGTFHVHYNTGG